MDKQQILNAYEFRHATKEFDPERKISKEDFDFILETGRLSPSSFGFEPWKFLVVQNPELRSRLLPVTWGASKQLPTASHFVIVLGRTKRGMAADSEHIAYMMREVQRLSDDNANHKAQMYHTFLQDDFRLLDDERAMFEWASRQNYIAIGNMMTAAALIGIDSCPIEGFDKGKVEDLLHQEGWIDRSDFGVSCMVAFGYRVRPAGTKTRQSIDRIADWIV